MIGCMCVSGLCQVQREISPMPLVALKNFDVCTATMGVACPLL